MALRKIWTIKFEITEHAFNVCFEFCMCKTQINCFLNSFLWYATAMRHLGIDYGSKRVGIAVSDSAGSMAFPKTVLANDEQLLTEIGELIDSYEVEVLVIGHSLDTTSSPNKIQPEIDELVTDMTLQFGLPIHLEPEQFTTQQALRIQGRTSQTDASAAALILDSFLQKQRSH